MGNCDNCFYIFGQSKMCVHCRTHPTGPDKWRPADDGVAIIRVRKHFEDGKPTCEGCCFRDQIEHACVFGVDNTNNEPGDICVVHHPKDEVL